MSQVAKDRAKAERHYKQSSPLTGRHKARKVDLKEIAASNRPIDKAASLIKQRKIEAADNSIEDMLKDLQGTKRKRYAYDQEAVIALEHLVTGQLDPQTQEPLWRDMLLRSRDGNLSKAEFYRDARTILIQHNLFDPVTMAG